MSIRKYEMTRPVFVNPNSRREVHEGVYCGSLPAIIKIQVHDSVGASNLSLNEALVLARLRHPNICKLYDYFLEQDAGQWRTVIVMERMDTDLLKEMARRKESSQPWTEAELWEALRTLAAALEHAQTHGIAHRDVKPSNVFLMESDLKLGDFGSALTLLDAGQVARTPLGSLLYVSPEMRAIFADFVERQEAAGTAYDPFKSDVYSLGVTVVAMALLSTPIEFARVLVDRGVVNAVLERVEGPYPKLVPHLKRMLAFAPEDRISYGDLLRSMSESKRQKARCSSLDLDLRPQPGSEPPPSERTYVQEAPIALRSGDDSIQVDQLKELRGSFVSTRYLQYERMMTKTKLWTAPASFLLSSSKPLCQVCDGAVSRKSWEELVQLTGNLRLPDLCSKECCEYFRRNPHISLGSCTICLRGTPITSRCALKLPCGHFVCSLKCMVERAKAVSWPLFESAEWRCLVCKQDASHVCDSAARQVDLARLLTTYCQKCWAKPFELTLPRCGHHCCKDCVRIFIIAICPICPKQ